MLDKEMDEYVTRVEDQAYEAGVSVGKSQERERLMREYMEDSMEYAKEFDDFVENHWALSMLDAPHSLVAVIETKISRAVLHERRRILDEVRSVAPDGGFVADIVESILRAEDMEGSE